MSYTLSIEPDIVKEAESCAVVFALSFACTAGSAKIVSANWIRGMIMFIR